MNTDKITTILGGIAAALIAVKPILDGTGYHFDEKTVMECSFAVIVALHGFFTNKQNNQKNSQ